MGEVYRARDTRLDRTVAIKVLPEHRLFDSGMRQRFVREARAIGNLSHPNICHLNDLGTHEGIDFLVMEYLDGETLADRVKRARGPLPLEEVFRIAIEMGDALSEAHRQGIVTSSLAT
jgi:serine/threonine protein kinase